MFRRKKGLVSAGKVLRVKTRHYVVPPGVALVSAIHMATGGFGIPVDYQPLYGAEFGIRVELLSDARVSNVRAVVFVGPVPVLKERVKSYAFPMPPSERVAEQIINGILDVLDAVSRWGYAGFMIAQSHPRYAMTVLKVIKDVKYPWARIASVRVPYEGSLLKLAEGVSYGDVVSVIDGRRTDEIQTKVIPRYEIGYAIYDQDITTLIYGYNPHGIRRLIEAESFTIKPLHELMKKKVNEEKEKKEE